MALIGKNVPGETPLSDQDLQGLKLPLLTTRGQLSAVEGPNIVSGKQWALGARRSQLPGMLSIEYLQELHRQMFRDVWQWAGEIRPTQLENAFASSVPDIVLIWRGYMQMPWNSGLQTQKWVLTNSP
jgi:fido (protein-threonine AMPylation protein)